MENSHINMFAVHHAAAACHHFICLAAVVPRGTVSVGPLVVISSEAHGSGLFRERCHEDEKSTHFMFWSRDRTRDETFLRLLF